MTRDQVEAATILRAVVGSTAHGLNVQDGIEDRDEMGVCIEPIEDVMGFSEFEQLIYRTAAEREGHHDAPSRAGDLDLTIYGLKKFCRLALKGNPTILTLLFTTPLQYDASGSQLLELTPAFVSRRAGGAFLGYLTAQKQRLLGERGSLKVHRPHFVEKFGYDVKFAMHALRLGFQGCELLRTGRITLPMPAPEREECRNVRLGNVSLQDVTTRIGELERDLKDLYDTSPLPLDPDTQKVEAWMTNMYLQTWKARDADQQLAKLRALYLS